MWRIIPILLLIGCVTPYEGHHKAAIHEWNKAWDYLDGQSVERTVVLERVVVHINGQSPCVKGAVGCATTGREVWIRGKVVGGEIIIDQWVLGHEVTHLLNWSDAKIKNPDTIGR